MPNTVDLVISILTHMHKYLGPVSNYQVCLNAPGEINFTDDSFCCEKGINWEQKTKIVTVMYHYPRYTR